MVKHHQLGKSIFATFLSNVEALDKDNLGIGELSYADIHREAINVANELPVDKTLPAAKAAEAKTTVSKVLMRMLEHELVYRDQREQALEDMSDLLSAYFKS